jgi:hypothetical protein
VNATASPSVPTVAGSLLARVAAFLNQPDREPFADLARDAFAFQREHVAPYRALCERRGIHAIADWSAAPLVPTTAFKTITFCAAEPQETFRSSGTTAGPDLPSVHHHPFPELYRAVIDASFPRFCLEPGERPAMLALIPSRELRPDSSLSFMVDHVMARYGEPTKSLWGLGARGVELAKVRSWLGARQREGRPVVVLATSIALAQLVEGLARLDLRFRLPPGSRLFETGGFKGRERELDRDELSGLTELRLGIPRARVLREYGMTELTSQLYTNGLLGGDDEHFVAPPWVRVQVLDPQTLAPAPTGTPGLVAIFDLANLGSALHVLTEDLGVLEPAGLRLLGRASGAELRGCSLAAEELAR